MDSRIKAAFDGLLEADVCDTRGLIEAAIEFTAELSVEELAADGNVVDPGDAYDAIVEGIRSSAERYLDRTNIIRVPGDVMCQICQKRFDEHPYDETVIGVDGEPYLRIGCAQSGSVRFLVS